MMLKPPPDAEVKEWDHGMVWFDHDGILNAISKKGPPRTLEEMKESIEQFKKFAGGRKVCALIDVTNAPETTREAREYAAEVFPEIMKAIAMVSDSALGKMLANLFFTLKTQPYPTKMFNDEKKAREWLSQFL